VLGRVTSTLEREYLKRVLKRFAGHLGRSAAHAGLNRRTLYNKMAELGVG
jgi:DNA-binding NtrC family response regulator